MIVQAGNHDPAQQRTTSLPLTPVLLLSLSATTVQLCRPDIATWLSDESLRKLMSEGTPEAEARTLLAALLLLPEGWQSPQLLGPEARDPRGWLVRYVKTVLQVRVLGAALSLYVGPVCLLSPLCVGLVRHRVISSH